ncbi:Uncharacterised protein [Mycobacteroides abscessus subsp. abscessus]|nr:Uncharacterised protein [Mycobacteroides abscessus subsp. abscessus]
MSGGDSDSGLTFGHLGTETAGNGACGGKGLALGAVLPDRCAEHREGRITFELVDHAFVSVDLFDDDGKEPVEQRDDLDCGAGRREAG